METRCCGLGMLVLMFTDRWDVSDATDEQCVMMGCRVMNVVLGPVLLCWGCEFGV